MIGDIQQSPSSRNAGTSFRRLWRAESFLRTSRVRGFSLHLFLIMAACLPAVTASGGSPREPERGVSAALQGVLMPGGTPVVKSAQRQYSLTATTTYVLHTLQDKRLNGREIRVEGTPK